MKRISKKVREEAALILQCCASADIYADEFGSTWQSMRGLDAGENAQRLAYAAWDHVHDHSTGLSWLDRRRVVYAEAESMLRTGWGPTSNRRWP